MNKRSEIQFSATPKNQLVSLFDNKELLSRVDVIGWNSLKKYNNIQHDDDDDDMVLPI